MGKKVNKLIFLVFISLKKLVFFSSSDDVFNFFGSKKDGQYFLALCQVFIVEKKQVKSIKIKTKHMLSIRLHKLYLCFSNFF